MLQLSSRANTLSQYCHARYCIARGNDGIELMNDNRIAKYEIAVSLRIPQGLLVVFVYRRVDNIEVPMTPARSLIWLTETPSCFALKKAP